MDFVSDQLVGRQRFQLLTLVDNYSRESLAIEVGQRLTGDDVVRVLEGCLHSVASHKRFESTTDQKLFRGAWICGRTQAA